MNKEEFDVLVNDILKIPQPKEELSVSAMASINVEELRQVIEAFNKIPDYNLLIKDNLKKDKEIEILTNNWNELEEWVRNLIDDNNNRYELYKDDKLHYEYEISNIKYQNNMLIAFLDKMKEIKNGDNND